MNTERRGIVGKVVQKIPPEEHSRYFWGGFREFLGPRCVYVLNEPGTTWLDRWLPWREFWHATIVTTDRTIETGEIHGFDARRPENTGGLPSDLYVEVTR